MFFRLIFTALVVYLGYRFFRAFRQKETTKNNIHGKQKSDPLDLRDADVDDARYEEINDGDD
jgi:hypothetical protein